jgi:pimeloyl-ACP methyl ester carboxylesterase
VATFVLVHGAWHGGWCWARVRRELQAQGHEVFTPTLTGVCEAAHLLTRAVDLSTHVDDVANLIRWQELSDVILCGHSYGGCVISGVGDQMPDRIAALVYLDAFVLQDGQALHDTLPAEAREAQLEGVLQVGEGWKVPPIPAEFFNVNAADRAWVDRQCTPQPLATFQEALRLEGGLGDIAHKGYVFASGWDGTPFQGFYDQAKADGWRTCEMACGHDVMLDQPGALVSELVATAKAAGVA